MLAHTQHAVVSPATLRGLLAKVRAQGWSQQAVVVLLWLQTAEGELIYTLLFSLYKQG